MLIDLARHKVPVLVFSSFESSSIEMRSDAIAQRMRIQP